jgi:hypothetical protein
LSSVTTPVTTTSVSLSKCGADEWCEYALEYMVDAKIAASTAGFIFNLPPSEINKLAKIIILLQTINNAIFVN